MQSLPHLITIDLIDLGLEEDVMKGARQGQHVIATNLAKWSDERQSRERRENTATSNNKKYHCGLF